MFNLTVTVPPAAGPVTGAELREWLRLNHTAEDAKLAELVAAAVAVFEELTGRPVLSTTYRQDLAAWPRQIVLGRGGVTAVSAVVRYTDAAGTTEALAHLADLKTAPARVVLADVPDPVEDANGIKVTPVGAVTFVAGWANAAAVPRDVVVAIKQLAGHYYRNPEAFTDSAFLAREVPLGLRAVVGKYKLGLSGPWGQQ